MIKSLHVALVLSALVARYVDAHELHTSYTDVNIRPDHEQLFLAVMIDESDLKRIFELDLDGDETVTSNELALALDDIQKHFAGKVSIIIRGELAQLQEQQPEIYADGLGNTFVRLRYFHELQSPPWALTLKLDFFEDFTPLHKNLVKVTYGEEIQQAILTHGTNQASFSFAGEGVSLAAKFGQFLWLGMEHIFIGYDHILFLLGLIIIGGGFLNLLKIVSSFTVAHSLTLILAALQIVVLPGRLVESVIALSIAYIAAENFFVKENDQRWLITFIFGLMHGFGFAGVLTELGLPTSGLVMSLLSFNVGVEVGQMVIVALLYPLVLWISKSARQRQIVYALSSVILAFGLLWFIERAFGLDIAFG